MINLFSLSQSKRAWFRHGYHRLSVIDERKKNKTTPKRYNDTWRTYIHSIAITPCSRYVVDKAQFQCKLMTEFRLKNTFRMFHFWKSHERWLNAFYGIFKQKAFWCALSIILCVSLSRNTNTQSHATAATATSNGATATGRMTVWKKKQKRKKIKQNTQHQQQAMRACVAIWSGRQKRIRVGVVWHFARFQTVRD